MKRIEISPIPRVIHETVIEKRHQEVNKDIVGWLRWKGSWGEEKIGIESQRQMVGRQKKVGSKRDRMLEANTDDDGDDSHSHVSTILIWIFYNFSFSFCINLETIFFSPTFLCVLLHCDSVISDCSILFAWMYNVVHIYNGLNNFNNLE